MIDKESRIRTLLKKNDYYAEVFCYPEFVFFKLPSGKLDEMSQLMRQPLEHGLSLLLSNETTLTLRTYAVKPIVKAFVDVTLLKESYDPRLAFYYDHRASEIDGINSFPLEQKEDIEKEEELFEAYEYIKMILKYPEFQHIDTDERQQAKEDFREFCANCNVKKSISTIKKVISYIYPLEELLR
jgi:hypothetical protein